MHTRNYALIGGAAVFGLVFILGTAATRANEGVDVPRGWQVAANDTTAKPSGNGPAISMDEISRRMEEKYNGDVTEMELDREWSGDVYEMEIRSANGHTWAIEANANTGEILEEERERDHDDD